MLGSTKVSALSQGEIGWERSAASGAPKLEFEVAEAADSRSDGPAGRASSPRGIAADPTTSRPPQTSRTRTASFLEQNGLFRRRDPQPRPVPPAARFAPRGPDYSLNR